MRKLAPALVLLLGLAGCATTAAPGATGPAPGSTAPTATSPRGCATLVSVTADDAGATPCVALNGQLVVFLNRDWAPTQLSAPGILYAVQETDSGFGLVMRVYAAIGAGSVDVTSSRSACPPPSPGSAACHAQQGWRITVTVR